MNTNSIEAFKHYFKQMDFSNIADLNTIYSDNIVFIDPIHKIQGIENLKQYFNKLNDNLVEGSFTFTDEDIIENKAYLTWEMNLKLKRPKKNVKALGISVLTLEEKIIRQRDYFDAGELFYENVPILGSVIRFLKGKLAN
ncbi:nuclear transport factor 2 family protein [Bernardetia sp. OM2101]|uniref:nuclear transport factor 2 family protein n=1 Tax=Bernardetia sp. OM2101 TaxID=3344876 RepID=UPI0035CF9468